MSQSTTTEEEIERLQNNINGAFAKISQLSARVEELEDELEQEREQRKEAERLAQTALGVANSVDDGDRADGGGPKKVDVAKNTARNYLVREAAQKPAQRNPATGAEVENNVASVSVSKVREMAEPEHDLKWQTVMDGWRKLAQNWDCFWIDDKSGEKRLLIGEQPPEAMIRAAELDLGRNDLAKRLVGEEEV